MHNMGLTRRLEGLCSFEQREDVGWNRPFDIGEVGGTRRFTGGVFGTVALPAGIGSGHEDVDTANGISGTGGKRRTFLLLFYGYLGAGSMYGPATSKPSGPAKWGRLAADGESPGMGRAEARRNQR